MAVSILRLYVKILMWICREGYQSLIKFKVKDKYVWFLDLMLKCPSWVQHLFDFCSLCQNGDMDILHIHDLEFFPEMKKFLIFGFFSQPFSGEIYIILSIQNKKWCFFWIFFWFFHFFFTSKIAFQQFYSFWNFFPFFSHF